MLNLAFKESGSSLDDIVSALIVELEKLGRQPLDRQASDDRAVAGKSRSGGRAELRPHDQRLRAGRKALTASRIEQSIVDAGFKGRHRRRDQPRGRHGKGGRPSRAASGGLGQVEGDAEASAAIESLAGDLARICEAAGYEVTGSSKRAGTGKALSRAV